MIEERSVNEIHASAWDGKLGACSVVDPFSLSNRNNGRNDAPVWVHVQVGNPPEAISYLKEQFGVDEIYAEDLISPHDRPHLRASDDALILSVHCARMEGPKVFFDEVGFVVRPGVLLTISTTPVKRIELERALWAQCGTRLGKTSAALLHTLLDSIVDDYFPVVDRLEDQVDTLETQILEGNVVDMKSILRLKRRLFETRRNLGPIRDVLNGLVRREVSLISGKEKGYFLDVFDHSLRIMETVDINIDMLTGILDAQLAIQDNKLNQAMRWLTVVATLLMSLSLVTGFYGMNFKHMPELDTPWAYPAVIGLMIVIAVVELAFFKKRGWLK